MNTSSHISSPVQVAARQVDVQRAATTVIATALIVVAGFAWHAVIAMALGSVR